MRACSRQSIFVIIFTGIGFFSLITYSKAFLELKLNEAPEIILFNGDIITMDDTSPLVEALAIKGDLIIGTGNKSEIFELKDSNTRLIDLQGKVVIPGFIDAHSHWIGDRGMTNQTEFDEVMDTLLVNGWTSINELFVNQERLDELQSMDAADRLKVRVNAYLPLSWQFERFGDWYQAYEPGYEYSSMLRIAGVKFFMDGWIREPILYFNQSELEELFQEAHNLGFQIAIHSMVTNATDIVLNAFETVLANQDNILRHRIEHLVLLRDDQIENMANLGILGCIQFPWFNSDWNDYINETDIHIPFLSRWRDLLDAGIHVMGSTDYPYTLHDTQSPIIAISMVMTRIGVKGGSPTNWMLNQTISAEGALRLLTIDAAYGTFQEDVKGSLEEGKYADLVVLSENPLTIPEGEIVDIKVLMTMVGGNVKYTADNFETECVNLSSSNFETSSSINSSATTISVIVPLVALIALVYKKKEI